MGRVLSNLIYLWAQELRLRNLFRILTRVCRDCFEKFATSMSTSAGALQPWLTGWHTEPKEMRSMHVFVGCAVRSGRSANDLQTVEPCYNFTSWTQWDTKTWIQQYASIQANFTVREREKVAICFTVHCCCFRWQPRLMRGGGREGDGVEEGKSHNKKQWKCEIPRLQVTKCHWFTRFVEPSCCGNFNIHFPDDKKKYQEGNCQEIQSDSKSFKFAYLSWQVTMSEKCDYDWRGKRVGEREEKNYRKFTQTSPIKHFN